MLDDMYPLSALDEDQQKAFALVHSTIAVKVASGLQLKVPWLQNFSVYAPIESTIWQISDFFISLYVLDWLWWSCAHWMKLGYMNLVLMPPLERIGA